MKSIPSIAAGILAIVLLLIGWYVGAYLGMGTLVPYSFTIAGKPYSVLHRRYRYEWAETAFVPAAWSESKMRGIEVIIIIETVPVGGGPLPGSPVVDPDA
jgi:hypothetical protein